MYGTTIRNYNNFNRSTREDINTRSFFGKSKKNKKVKKEETKRTRYMKIDENVSRESETTKTDSGLNAGFFDRKGNRCRIVSPK